MKYLNSKNAILLKLRNVTFNVLMGSLAFYYCSCKEGSHPDYIASTYVYIKPEYGNIQLMPTNDTLHFNLPKNSYNEIKSFNYFIQDDSAYISFYDRRSESVSIYNWNSRKLINQINLRKTFNNKRFFKTSVYTTSFDSILVTNVGDLFLLDSSGSIKNKIPFVQKNEAMAYFEAPVPVITKQKQVFMGVRPFLKETSMPDIRNWKIVYGFDFKNKTAELRYQLPSVYRKGYYGWRFFEFSYCYNGNGRFVFSFPADSNIYETDFTDYHFEYYAKSKFQREPITPVSKETLENNMGVREYSLHDYYGPIYYDPGKKRYLRFMKQKVSKELYETKNYDRQLSAIVLNENFKIIGEFVFNKEYLYNTIFFTQDGGIYARVNSKDENALHLVRLTWNEDAKE